MPATDYPPGDTPPPLLRKGPGFENLNTLFGWLISMTTIPADPSLVWTPGTPESPGRLRSTSTGGAAAAPETPPFTVVDATAKDKAGGPYPGRVRVYKGFLGGLRPAEMNVVDGLLPDGTDKRCYLTLPEGTGYVCGKLGVDPATGLFVSANVYQSTSAPVRDGNFLYLQIAIVTVTGGQPAIEQNFTGNWGPVALSSADGTILYPIGG